MIPLHGQGVAGARQPVGAACDHPSAGGLSSTTQAPLDYELEIFGNVKVLRTASDGYEHARTSIVEAVQHLNQRCWIRLWAAAKISRLETLRKGSLKNDCLVAVGKFDSSKDSGTSRKVKRLCPNP